MMYRTLLIHPLMILLNGWLLTATWLGMRDVIEARGSLSRWIALLLRRISAHTRACVHIAMAGRAHGSSGSILVAPSATKTILMVGLVVRYSLVVRWAATPASLVRGDVRTASLLLIVVMHVAVVLMMLLSLPTLS